MDFKQFLEIKENKNKGLPKLPKRKTFLKEYNFIVDTRDRDRSIFPNPNFFKLKINAGDHSNPTINFKYINIKEIKLISVVLPKIVTSYPYLILDIPELNNEYLKGTNNALNNCFAIIIPEQHDNPGNFVNCSIHYLESQKHIFYPPLSSLPQTLTFNLKYPDGTMANLGTDDSLPSAPKNSVQCFYAFKILCVHEDPSVLNSTLI